MNQSPLGIKFFHIGRDNSLSPINMDEIQLKLSSFLPFLYNRPLLEQKCEIYHLHPNLHNVTLRNVTPSLISQNPRERTCSVLISLFVVTRPLADHGRRHYNDPPKQFIPQTYTHHVVIIAILASCYSILSHATLTTQTHILVRVTNER